uniref:Uncharacterized protein n=1 Tax=Anguilla anguilla TaxID=7936 RepID=A0A0E9SKW3_ANGAN
MCQYWYSESIIATHGYMAILGFGFNIGVRTA